MTYVDYVTLQIQSKKTGQPIYSHDISNKLKEYFHLSDKQATAATAVALNRIMKSKRIGNIRFYQKGIYYLTKETVFGEIGINKECLIFDKYISDNRGYETGLVFANKLGLTTQLPRNIELVTNEARNGKRYDKNLDIYIKPPKIYLTSSNIQYLQLLDILEMIDKVPIDVDNPFKILAKYLKKHKLQYGLLLAYADDYYGKNALINLAHIAKAQNCL